MNSYKYCAVTGNVSKKNCTDQDYGVFTTSSTSSSPVRLSIWPKMWAERHCTIRLSGFTEYFLGFGRQAMIIAASVGVRSLACLLKYAFDAASMPNMPGPISITLRYTSIIRRLPHVHSMS